MSLFCIIRIVGDDERDPQGRGLGYREIAAELARLVEEGAIAAGAFLPSEKDLQLRFRASRTTVRRALSKLVDDGLASSVPNRGVVVRRSGRRNTPAIAFVNGNTIVLRHIFSRLSSALLERGYHLVHIDSESLGVENSLQFAVERGFEGAFIWSFQGFYDLPAIRKSQEHLSLVVLDHAIPGLGADLVTLDYFAMASQIVRHLAEVGRRHIALTGMLDMLDVTQARFAGYLKGMFDAGFEPMARDFAFIWTSGMKAPDPHLLEKRLADADRPDALFVMQDEMVLPAAETIYRLGLRIPDDVALATIGDDIQVSAGGVGLTAAHCEWDAFADLALGAMLERLSGCAEPPRRLVAAHKLVVRGSCGAPVGGRTNLEETLLTARRA